MRNVRLANIYIKIHNKRPLTMDDMVFLSKYDPECFAKTCHNLIYNVPETKPLLEPEDTVMQPDTETVQPERTFHQIEEEARLLEKEKVETFLANLRQMEVDEKMVKDVSADRVKSLVGNLFMEMLFPHNDRERYFEMKEPPKNSFNQKA